jgi:hypothetical protein
MDKRAIHHAIVAEIVKALEGIRPPVVPPKLLDVIASWGETLDDADVLELLRRWNETGDIRPS